MPSEMFEQNLKNLAQELGVSGIKRISAFDIVIGDWVRLKCQYGCPNFGKLLTCPPYSPTPDEMRKILQGYSVAYLLRYDIPDEILNVETHPDPGVQKDTLAKALDIFLRLERYAFLSGYRKAFVFGLNHCPNCEHCVLEDSNGNGICRFPIVTRPSLEACGIDVYKTVETAGWTEDVHGGDRLKGDNIISMVSIILVD